MFKPTYKRKSIITHPVGFLSFFYYFIGSIGFVSYFYAVIKTRFVLPRKDWLIILGLIGLFIISSINATLWDSLITYRFHFGFFIFYLFFRNKTNRFDIKKLLGLMLLMVIAESILVNSLLDAASLPNYSGSDITNSSHFSSDWQRAYTYGGNASVASVLLVAIMAYARPKFLVVSITGVAVVMLGSGSGMLVYMAYFVYFSKNSMKIFYLISALFVTLIASKVDFLYKISLEYMIIILEIKMSQVVEISSYMNGFELLSGTGSAMHTGGDFLWQSFYHVHGLLGLLLMILILFSHMNHFNRFPLMIIFLMTTHYFVLFSLPGQLIAGYLLAIRPVRKDSNSGKYSGYTR
jgi:hypothetical protein